MPLSLHAAFIPSARQLLAATLGMIDKADAFCREQALAPAALLGRRLIADMHDLGYQVKSVAVHTAGAIEGVRAGRFSPDLSEPAPTFDTHRALLRAADATLAGVDEAEAEGWIGADMAFVRGEFRMPFTADQFLLSFSQPNHYFHASTAYGILRKEGVPLGKIDFLGRVRRLP